MDVLKKYRVFCVTENVFHETWRTSTPLTCPCDYRHTIDSGQTLELERKALESGNAQQVYINAKSYQDTSGYYMVEGRKYVISETETYTSDFVLHIPNCVYGLKIGTTQDHIGDSFSIIINPDTAVGAVTAGVASGENTVSVSSSVVHNCMPGFYVYIDGNEYMITEKNIQENKIKLYPSLVSNVEAGSVVYLNLYIAKNYQIQGIGTSEIGYGSMGGKTLPGGSILRLKYRNTGGAPKILTINYEFTY